MAEKRHNGALDAGFAMLRVLWDETDDSHHLTFKELEAAIGKGVLDRRWIWQAIDSANSNGFDVRRPLKTDSRSTGYRYEGRPFDNWEVGFLCDQIECSHGLTAKEKGSLLRRVLKLAPKMERGKLRRRIISEAPRNLYRGEFEEKLETLNQAINESRRVRFVYYEYAEEGELRERMSSSRVPIEPYCFVFRDGNYYLLGGRECEGEIQLRIYRLDRVDDVRILDEFCESSLMELGVDPTTILRRSFGMFLDGEAVQVTLSFNDNIEKYVVERFPDAEIVRNDGGGLKVEIDVIPSPPFFAWVFQFAGSMNIEEPSEVVAEYRKMLDVAKNR